MTRESEIRALRETIAAFDRADFGMSVTAEFENPPRTFPMPEHNPVRGMHPRLLLTSADLDGIRRALTAEENAAAAADFARLADDTRDGVLPPPTLHRHGRRGNHNFDNELLASIQARALNYLLTGDAVYGYRAICAMLNYIRTMNIRWIGSDQCREFGFAAYIAACVYDWCYDLLTDEAKFLMTAGIEHRMFTGTTEDTIHASFHGVRFEIGFPPCEQGAVGGHGSEMQLLRDFLAYALAIYDEYPAWWNYGTGRIYDEYVPARNYYYETGMIHQGIPCYSTWRFFSDLYSAWILEKSTGVNPYIDKMGEVILSIIARETADGHFMHSGDTFMDRVNPQLNGCALVTSYLYHNPTLRAYAKFRELGFSKFDYGTSSVLPAEMLILSSGGVECAASHREGMAQITYNPYPLGEIVSRTRWDSKNAAVVLTKIGERTVGGHEHADSGHFMIYYKGMLADDTGLYTGWGNPHHTYYHRAAIAHNTLLIFNPEHYDEEPVYNESGRLTNAARYWYAGGHTVMWEPVNVDVWKLPGHNTGKVTGVQYAYKPDGVTPDYTYISGEITEGYPEHTADYVGRRMLTVYTDDPAYPVLLFVSDRIDACDASFKKSFLLHTLKEPVIDAGKRQVYFDNGKATLFLHSVAGGDSIRAYGGPGKTFWHVQHGENNTDPTELDGPHWGRVEISPKPGRKSDCMMNVLTVADGVTDTCLPVRGITGDGVQGASVGGICAVFATDTAPVGGRISFALAESEARCFAAGLAAGTWTVTVNGQPIGRAEATETGGLLIFRAPAGRIELIKE
ncbi:MAG: hypothetical protein E7632_03530 [Ruminococcaceae bacterium]|nr:hypothetical protein [Oscillospiraceae bacterium]